MKCRKHFRIRCANIRQRAISGCVRLKAAHIEWYKITGETAKEKRIELVRDFNEGTVPVFLISLKAGGTGLNLTGADVVIHYDPWWNLKFSLNSLL